MLGIVMSGVGGAFVTWLVTWYYYRVQRLAVARSEREYASAIEALVEYLALPDQERRTFEISKGEDGTWRLRKLRAIEDVAFPPLVQAIIEVGHLSEAATSLLLRELTEAAIKHYLGKGTSEGGVEQLEAICRKYTTLGIDELRGMAQGSSGNGDIEGHL